MPIPFNDLIGFCLKDAEPDVIRQAGYFDGNRYVIACSISQWPHGGSSDKMYYVASDGKLPKTGPEWNGKHPVTTLQIKSTEPTFPPLPPLPSAPEKLEGIGLVTEVTSRARVCVPTGDSTTTVQINTTADIPGRDVKRVYGQLVLPGHVPIVPGRLVRITIEYVEERDLPAYDPA